MIFEHFSLSNPHVTLNMLCSPLAGKKKVEAYCPFEFTRRYGIIHLKRLAHLEIVHFNSTEMRGLQW